MQTHGPSATETPLAERLIAASHKVVLDDGPEHRIPRLIIACYYLPLNYDRYVTNFPREKNTCSISSSRTPEGLTNFRINEEHWLVPFKSVSDWGNVLCILLRRAAFCARDVCVLHTAHK
jgi:hypothetical protein